MRHSHKWVGWLYRNEDLCTDMIPCNKWIFTDGLHVNGSIINDYISAKADNIFPDFDVQDD